MKLACSSKLAPGDSFPEKLANLERYGYEGVEILLPENEANTQRITEIEDALAKSTVKVCSVMVPSVVYKVPFDSEDALDGRLKNAKRALEIGATLGGSVFITPEYCPQYPLSLWDRPESLSERVQDKDLLLSFLGGVAEYAESASVTVVLEPINRYETRFYHTVEDVIAVCDELGSDRIKIVIDLFHMNIEELEIAASIESAAGYIYHVQLADSNRELPGQGHIDFASAFAALRRIGYDRYMALECRIPSDPEREIAECVGYLRQCLNENIGL